MATTIKATSPKPRFQFITTPFYSVFSLRRLALFPFKTRRLSRHSRESGNDEKGIVYIFERKPL